MTPIQQIAAIDKKIDGIRLELYRRGRRPMYSASEWQLAWNLHPDLWARSQELYGQRGAVQLERDALIEKEYHAEQRRLRAARRKTLVRKAATRIVEQ